MVVPKGPTQQESVPEYVNFRAKLQKGANSSILDNPSAYTSGGSRLQTNTFNSLPTVASTPANVSSTAKTAEVPAAKTAEVPAAKTAEVPSEGPVEVPAEEPVEAPAEEPVEAPAEEPVEAPAEEPVEAPVEESIEMLAEKPEEVPDKSFEQNTAVSTAGASSVASAAGATKSPLPKGPTEESGAPEYAGFRAKLQKSDNSDILNNPSAYTSGGTKLTGSTDTRSVSAPTKPAASLARPVSAAPSKPAASLARPVSAAPSKPASSIASNIAAFNKPKEPTVTRSRLHKGPTDAQTVPEYANFRNKLKKSDNSGVLDNPGAYSSGGSKLYNGAA
eukprot:CAMPEP_0198736740 /NCGR_PEP_ID=MMETSP1475-20131203/67512_1 /TAXON_ID= ORGANISM="Unidentified sp., Strain CCMP1999" /NCGR_SAMPLE_ID=MMETSP1475 /ASSEMBLY_ACC=CAM_ASM_001111 /LENGTH=332 /DNA_ID=CAMNT_0044500589 /DNA_START=926 /DNA_END=1924 /DNA_ORIENTATION=+